MEELARAIEAKRRERLKSQPGQSMSGVATKAALARLENIYDHDREPGRSRR